MGRALSRGPRCRRLDDRHLGERVRVRGMTDPIRPSITA